MYLTNSTALKLHAFLQRWLCDNPSWCYPSPGWWQQPRSAAEIATDLLKDAEFGELKLAGWLNSPEGLLIQTVVRLVLPQPYGAEIELLVEAITRAAQAQQEHERERAQGWTLVTAGTIVLLVVGVLWSQRGNPA